MSRAEVQDVVSNTLGVSRFSASHLEQSSVKLPSPAIVADSADFNVLASSVVAMLGFEKGIILKALPHNQFFGRSA